MGDMHDKDVRSLLERAAAEISSGHEQMDGDATAYYRLPVRWADGEVTDARYILQPIKCWAESGLAAVDGMIASARETAALIVSNWTDAEQRSAAKYGLRYVWRVRPTLSKVVDFELKQSGYVAYCRFTVCPVVPGPTLPKVGYDESIG